MIQKFLCLDGGGIRGYLTACILEKIQYKLPNPLNKDLTKENNLVDYFDVITGTSTGSILAAAISSNRSISEIKKLYEEEGHEFFPHNDVKLGNKFGVKELMRGKVKHSNLGLEKVLKRQFMNADGSLIKMKDLTKQTLIQSYNNTLKKAIVFDSTAKDESIANLELWQVVKSSCSAPGYFEPHQLEYAGVSSEMIDGGVFANNPTLVGIAKSLFQDKVIHCMSVGTSEKDMQREGMSRFKTSSGLWSWGMDIFGNTMSRMPHHAAQFLMWLFANKKSSYLRFQIITEKFMEIDDASPEAFKKMAQIADEYVTNFKINKKLYKQHKIHGFLYSQNMRMLKRWDSSLIKSVIR